MEYGRLYTAMITPMYDNEKVDYHKAGVLANHLIENGSDGVVVAGTTGEAPLLTYKEKIELFKVVREAVGNRGHVIAGTGGNETVEAVEMTRDAQEIGCDASMLVVPYYNKPPQDLIYKHFKMVAEVSRKIPIILYNIPGRTAVNMLPETVVKLADEFPNINAIKEASGSIDQIMEIRRMTNNKMKIFSGDDCMTLPILSIGGHGLISVSSHVVGNELKQMIKYYVAGDVEYARKINDKLYPVYKSMFLTTNPIPVKTAMNLLGHEAGPMRMPMELASGKVLDELKSALKTYGIKINE